MKMGRKIVNARILELSTNNPETTTTLKLAINASIFRIVTIPDARKSDVSCAIKAS